MMVRASAPRGSSAEPMVIPVGTKVSIRTIELRQTVHARHGYLRTRGTTKNAKRAVGLSRCVADMLAERSRLSVSRYVFPGNSPDTPILGTSLDHQHDR